MRLGYIGAGNMAGAMARGLGDPVLASDSGSGRAAALAAELGGEALTSREVAERADVVVLAHKPYQLAAVAAEIDGRAQAVASLLGGVGLAELRSAYPGTPVVSLMPNTPIAVRRGIVLMCAEEPAERELAARIRPHLERLGRVEELPESRMAAGTLAMGVAPAYFAVIVEAMADGALKHGLPAPLALELVTETMAGTAALLRAHGHDTVATRREVTSPGGSTARGLAALERAGLRAAFLDAADAVATP